MFQLEDISLIAKNDIWMNLSASTLWLSNCIVVTWCKKSSSISKGLRIHEPYTTPPQWLKRLCQWFHNLYFTICFFSASPWIGELPKKTSPAGLQEVTFLCTDGFKKMHLLMPRRTGDGQGRGLPRRWDLVIPSSTNCSWFVSMTYSGSYDELCSYEYNIQ